MTNGKTRKSSVTILRNRFFRTVWTTRNTVNATDRIVFISTTLRELLLYIVFLTLLLIIALTSLNSMTYFYNTSVFNRFVLTASLSPSDDQPALQTIDDHASMWNYIKGQLMDALYHDAWYNRLNVSFNEKEFIGHDNKLLGTARLRQLKVDPLKCNTPKYMGSIVEKCYPAYSIETRYTGPIEIQGNITPLYTIKAWNFSTSAITGASSYSAPYGSYDGSGYIQDLSRSRDETEAILSELFLGRWIDQSTRVLFIDFALYNANINMFIIVKIIFEMPESGGLFSSSEIQPVRLFRYQTSTDYFVLACEIVYLIFLVYYIIEEILELSVKRWKYFISIWNLMDLAMVVISLICAGFLIYSDIIVADRMSTLINDVSSYPNFDSLSNLHSLYIRSMAICVFLGMIKIFKYLTIDRSLNQLTRTMDIAANDLFGFLVMFCIVYFAYAQMSYLAFSARTIEYSSFTQTTYSLLRIMLGDISFPSILKSHPVLGPVFFVTFVFFVFFVLLNMFLAIVDESYKATKAELIKQKNDLTLYHILKKKTKDLAKRVQKKRSKSIIRILRECGLMGLEKLPYEYYRKALKNHGYSDPEILSTFLKYDEDGDNNLDLVEQQQLAYEIEMGVIYKTGDPADEGIGTDEDSKENLSETIRDEDNYVDPEDYNELVQNVDLMEATLISIITRIDELLASLEKIEIAKREHRMQLSGIIKDMSQSIQCQYA
ncbi:Polycystic kidney disease 2-like 1 protein isoform 2 [Schistosoma japonicum]|uniref:Polycystic kidney disease 2-like 1 protein isoform 2 n=3 Tax=Schistosoma japonicum TaxID=6182 RepID=A0A4Z2D8T5_SCHJA|nr:Polycystic kidney disease 2-like 1 protein isoform 2 [Schistosoma japonicum]